MGGFHRDLNKEMGCLRKCSVEKGLVIRVSVIISEQVICCGPLVVSLQIRASAPQSTLWSLTPIHVGRLAETNTVQGHTHGTLLSPKSNIKP